MNINRWVVIVLFTAACTGAAFASPQEDQETKMRTMQYKACSREETIIWQNDLRKRLFKLMKMEDVASAKRITLEPKEVSSYDMGEYLFKEMTIRSTKGRTIEIVTTVPKNGKGPFPAVVCIAGHGSNRFSTYANGQAFGPQPASESGSSRIYKGFAAELAERGYVTVAIEVSRHEVREEGRMLAGERLWDLMRCVDFLESLPVVDKSRMGCAGLSLGGEMTMWLAAMDPRMKASLSAGFLTTMNQMEKDHCMCWKFDGLRELVDFADIFSMIAPRALQCQNGRKEPPSQFPPKLARKAIGEIYPAYAAFQALDNVSLDIHDGDHEIDLPELLAFFEKHLKE